MLAEVIPPGSYPIPFHGTTRAAILDAALTLVRRQGWASTSIDQICRTARVTKGAFFHYFGSKEDLGVAAAERWQDVTSALFVAADYFQISDPLERIYAYLDLRAKLAEGPLEAVTCFAGTTVQETFATSERIRAACGESIDAHVAMLTRDFEELIERYPPREPVTAEDLALYTQTVMQGAFVIAKARGGTEPVRAALTHLKRYLAQLFGEPKPDSDTNKSE